MRIISYQSTVGSEYNQISGYTVSNIIRRHCVESLNNECTFINMKINTDKTQNMAIGRQSHNLNKTADNQNLKPLNVFTYLDTIFSEDGRMDSEIGIRCNKAL